MRQRNTGLQELTNHTRELEVYVEIINAFLKNQRGYTESKYEGVEVMVLYYNKNKFKSENDDSQMCQASLVGLTNLWLMSSFCMTPLFWPHVILNRGQVLLPELTAQFSSLKCFVSFYIANSHGECCPSCGQLRCGKEDWDILLMPVIDDCTDEQ